MCPIKGLFIYLFIDFLSNLKKYVFGSFPSLLLHISVWNLWLSLVPSVLGVAA